ncbi:hypothetical protein E0W80_09500 [Microbacterium sp. PI-1]|uniref:hypothetical protein n=1 Tax=unclassified Microbacterium TaxID=2609290 RepID=UPI00103F6E79|nr:MULTISPECIES: hypothetical protein [unclassified Microbacterium]TCJ23785.1 hypothetical protein E0W80_09500 [Microbacterium sp. PI-1]UUE20076.1 hypothetical protein LRQ07_14955 [Microbacterium sp. J1-1]
MNDVAEKLQTALAAVRTSTDSALAGWAWAEPSYRASPVRAFLGESAPLTIADEGMPAMESAMGTLLRDQRVTRNWREEDLWTAVLSLLAAASVGHAPDFAEAVERIVKPRPVRIAAALANVAWTSEPSAFGSLAIAKVQDEAGARQLAASLSLTDSAETAFVSYAQQLLREFGDFVLATSTTPRQGQLAMEDFERTLEDLIGLSLMLSGDLADYGIFSLRGATNRPGIRGTTLDRSAVSTLLATSGAGELADRVLTITGWSAGNNFRWHSADPLPLDRILSADRCSRIGDLLVAPDAIAQRLRVAGRWYARAFWAEAQDDAALAVSVALDSMLTGKDAVPGAVSKGRFALLERDPAARAARFDRYEEVYRVRSAVAHGGDASRGLARIGGARSILEDAQWVAMQLLELREISAPDDDKQFRELWSAIQWGTVSWAHPPSSSI